MSAQVLRLALLNRWRFRGSGFLAAAAGVAVVVIVTFAELVNIAAPTAAVPLGSGGSAPGAHVVTLTCEQGRKSIR